MPFDQRLLLADPLAFLCGFSLGSANAGRMAALRFRAENAHRLPYTQPGWYLYHKSKNYYRMRAGIQEGMRKGTFLMAWATVFFLIEESVDVFRGTWRAGRTLNEMEGVDELDLGRMAGEVERSRDFWSTGVAGIVTGGLWSAWSHFPAQDAARTMRLGLVGGLAYGLLQDGLMYLRAKKVGYDAEPWYRRGAKNLKNQENSEQAEEKS
ncbi:hypothetical protein GQ43DRAFT_443525 [Delitschia confertaspora ATCC 74209]|uniref:Uncharacterized protein n=1 Tax=Delitschia confertaspora ATCC 74209 TaxID=1513339 RepID=A0A9P4MVQ9_9PLEO|nr:hypothetical protein GQ43DRAFT_443525 [Delitschia confertaspora ATCC 74209]